MSIPSSLKAALLSHFYSPFCPHPRANVRHEGRRPVRIFRRKARSSSNGRPKWSSNLMAPRRATFTPAVRIQSDAGVRQYGILRFPYQASVERIEVQDVRVTNPNGAVVVTPPDSIQDVTSEIYGNAPLYSDLREKHIAVKGLEPGDTLDYSIRWQLEKPLAKGQFWFGYQFIKSAVVLDEQLEISVPREREVKLKSQTIQPTMREETGRRIYSWKTSNLESQSVEKQKEVQSLRRFPRIAPVAGRTDQQFSHLGRSGPMV